MSPFDEDDFSEVEDTFVGDLPDLPVDAPTPAEIAAEDGTVLEVVQDDFKREEITAPHDGGEWLAGFNACRKAMFMDYDRAIKVWSRAFGFTEGKADQVAESISRLALGNDTRNKLAGG